MARRHKSALILGVVFLLFSASSVFASIVDTDSEAIQNIAAKYRQSVVEIYASVKYSDGRMEESGGTGFFIDTEGHILTAAHVVYDDKDLAVDELRVSTEEKAARDAGRRDKSYKYQVVFKDKKYSAHFVGSNRYADVAIIKLDKPPSDEFLPAPLGNSDSLTVGEFVVAIGNPVWLTNSISSGIVSALHRRDYELWFIEDFIQTDAPINPGNSGGPLINMAGEVVGINDAGYRNMDGLGFAVPINLAAEYIERMKKEGDLKIIPLGLKTLPKNFPRSGGFEDIKKLNELLDWDELVDLALLSEISKLKSAIVTEVKNGSPAEKAGLKVGDVIIKFNGLAVNETFDLRLARLKTGDAKDAVPVEVFRISGGKVETLVLKIEPEKIKNEEKPFSH